MLRHNREWGEWGGKGVVSVCVYVCAYMCVCVGVAIRGEGLMSFSLCCAYGQSFVTIFFYIKPLVISKQNALSLHQLPSFA